MLLHCPWHYAAVHWKLLTIINNKKFVLILQGYWHQRADDRHGNPLPRLPGAISGQKQSWKTPRWEWGKQVHGMWYFPFSALTLLVGQQEGHLACNNWMLVCWWWWFDWSFARLIAPVVQLSPPSPSSIILCFNKHRPTQVHLEYGC